MERSKAGALCEYQIQSNSEVPIYQQLVDAIHSDIKSGVLPAGTRLPTVRDLAERLHLACGTIKKAYDELETLGLIEMTRGRGTFVSQLKESSGSRKDRAMAAIDNLLDLMSALAFSPEEVEIFLNLKMRERAQRSVGIKVALVECSIESLTQLAEQIHGIDNVDIYQYVLDDVLAYPHKLGEDTDLIITSPTHFEQLKQIVLQQEKVTRVALRWSSQTVLRLAKLKKGQRVGILCKSIRFGELLRNACRKYADQVEPPLIYLMNDTVAWDKLASELDVLLLPAGYAKLCSNADYAHIQRFGCERQVFTCAYQIDQGSFLYLEDQINTLRTKMKG